MNVRPLSQKDFERASSVGQLWISIIYQLKRHPPRERCQWECEWALEGCKRLFVHGDTTKATPTPMNGSLECASERMQKAVRCMALQEKQHQRRWMKALKNQVGMGAREAHKKAARKKPWWVIRSIFLGEAQPWGQIDKYFARMAWPLGWIENSIARGAWLWGKIEDNIARGAK